MCSVGSKQQRHQQLVCATQRQSAASETGGWCRTASRTDTNLYVTDHQLAAALANFLAGKSVIGLGDGQGHYRRLMLATGNITRYDAFDGAPFIDNITHGQVHQHSLRPTFNVVYNQMAQRGLLSGLSLLFALRLNFGGMEQVPNNFTGRI